MCEPAGCLITAQSRVWHGLRKFRRINLLQDVLADTGVALVITPKPCAVTCLSLFFDDAHLLQRGKDICARRDWLHVENGCQVVVSHHSWDALLELLSQCPPASDRYHWIRRLLFLFSHATPPRNTGLYSRSAQAVGNTVTASELRTGSGRHEGEASARITSALTPHSEIRSSGYPP